MVAAGVIAIHHIPSSDNLVDVNSHEEMEFANKSKRMPNRRDALIDITNRNDDLHDGITEIEMLLPPIIFMDYGEHTSVDLEYPIAKHRFKDETWGDRIESFLLTMLWCSKKQAMVISLLSSLMKSKPVLSHRNLFLHRMGSDKM